MGTEEGESRKSSIVVLPDRVELLLCTANDSRQVGLAARVRFQTDSNVLYNNMDSLRASVDTLTLENISHNEKHLEVDETKIVILKMENSTKQKNRRKASADHTCKKLRNVSLDEVAWHDTFDNCWIVIYDYVYDCTKFIESHPGGQDVLLEYAGRDATLAFVGTGHSRAARKALEEYLIGELPPNERIFRTPGGVRVSEI